jgi:hypothetical protein
MVIDHNTGVHTYVTVHSIAFRTRAETRKCVQQPLEEKESSKAMARKMYSLLILAGVTIVGVLHSSSLSHHHPCSYKQQTFAISR